MKLIEDIKYIYDNQIVPMCNNIKNAVASSETPTEDTLISLKNSLNDCFSDYRYICDTINFTFNSDKLLFGIMINPIISDSAMIGIIIDDPANEVVLNTYQLEIDSKLVENITGEELAAVLLEEIASMMDPLNLERCKDILALLIADRGTFDLRSSINYTQIITYAFKKTMRKASTLVNKSRDSIAMSKITNELELKDTLVNVQDNLKITLYGFVDVETVPKMGELEWALMVYDDIKTNIRYAEDLLNTAKLTTASVLEINEINITLKSMRRAYNEVIVESANMEEKLVSEISIFKKLKTSGLKSIENDLYELKLQVKTCVEQEEALFILKQINTRIGILDDYLSNEEISETDRVKWNAVNMEYRSLREELVKKKLSMRKNIGYFVDYDKINQIE